MYTWIKVARRRRSWHRRVSVELRAAVKIKDRLYRVTGQGKSVRGVPREGQHSSIDDSSLS
ncbi:hypothetical protein E2C01_099291 [Portunus trituberculatus]|uniref:Uncharacterized protein n=1 Tax=Portunus trituberculatus TaxID=210409 RepID=A0A5B7KF23_PORTR|nr:hypothetical protein [Portunus trituberculatus]